MAEKRFLQNAAARARPVPWAARQQAAGPVRPSLVIDPTHALVAQLDRASDFESEGREFESLRARQHKGLKIKGFLAFAFVLFGKSRVAFCIS